MPPKNKYSKFGNGWDSEAEDTAIKEKRPIKIIISKETRTN